jgi:hypothetical protein
MTDEERATKWTIYNPDTGEVIASGLSSRKEIDEVRLRLLEITPDYEHPLAEEDMLVMKVSAPQGLKIWTDEGYRQLAKERGWATALPQA